MIHWEGDVLASVNYAVQFMIGKYASQIVLVHLTLSKQNHNTKQLVVNVKL